MEKLYIQIGFNNKIPAVTLVYFDENKREYWLLIRRKAYNLPPANGFFDGILAMELKQMIGKLCRNLSDFA